MQTLKGGFLNGPQITELTIGSECEKPVNKVEVEAWKAFVLIMKKFLGNNKVSNCAKRVTDVLTAVRNLACNTNIRVHCLLPHMD